MMIRYLLFLCTLSLCVGCGNRAVDDDCCEDLIAERVSLNREIRRNEREVQRLLTIDKTRARLLDERTDELRMELCQIDEQIQILEGQDD